jgi:hypothetical protein
MPGETYTFNSNGSSNVQRRIEQAPALAPVGLAVITRGGLISILVFSAFTMVPAAVAPPSVAAPSVDAPSIDDRSAGANGSPRDAAAVRAMVNVLLDAAAALPATARIKRFAEIAGKYPDSADAHFEYGESLYYSNSDDPNAQVQAFVHMRRGYDLAAEDTKYEYAQALKDLFEVAGETEAIEAIRVDFERWSLTWHKGFYLKDHRRPFDAVPAPEIQMPTLPLPGTSEPPAVTDRD